MSSSLLNPTQSTLNETFSALLKVAIIFKARVCSFLHILFMIEVWISIIKYLQINFCNYLRCESKNSEASWWWLCAAGRTTSLPQAFEIAFEEITKPDVPHHSLLTIFDFARDVDKEKRTYTSTILWISVRRFETATLPGAGLKYC